MGFKGYSSPNCNFCWGFNNFDYQTNKHKYGQSNKQTNQMISLQSEKEHILTAQKQLARLNIGNPGQHMATPLGKDGMCSV